MSNKPTYKDAGVDTEAGREFVSSIKDVVKSTYSKNVLAGIGGFSAAFDVSFLKDYKNPVLLSGTDGVGTKLELARLLGKHDTVGIDLVAMCANDILVNGGKPLFFLDYMSCGKLEISKMNQIVRGIAKGCELAGASLIGGETAEHPGIMKADEYDLAGFVVGAVEKEDIIDGNSIETGDVLLALSSSGPHSNGFSLLRKLYLSDGQLPKSETELSFIRDFLMQPTKIYVKPILNVLSQHKVKGMVHITGGGFYENIPRVFKKDFTARIELKKLPPSYVFDKIQTDKGLDSREMFSTFNMGTGFLLVVSKNDADSIMESLKREGEEAYLIGEISAFKGEEVHLY
ncbi:MAG: phosphoribosylformylglycinamidine cyclo-ligase [Leptospiraceae bacterium]|nr:phosphoribosylformylglycinamidine cyclo-ligase [Leptospiraceae bacterium]